MKGILCFGDSITFGRGEIPNYGWCGRLKESFEKKDRYNCVYNLGIPGETSTELLKRINIELKSRALIKRSQDRFLTLIAIGINDCKYDGDPKNKKPRTTEEKFRKNIFNLIKIVQSHNTKIGFIGLTPVDKKRTKPYEDTWFLPELVKVFDKIIKEQCKENHILFCDIFDKMSKLDYPKYLSDGLHPNSKGYQLMFKEIKKFIQKHQLI
jgi:lysophospholipase L1-like esterase